MSHSREQTTASSLVVQIGAALRMREPTGPIPNPVVKVAHGLARWRWPLAFAAVIVEAVLTRGVLPADLSYFSAKGELILRGHFSAVYADSFNQAGPLQLLLNWLLLVGGRLQSPSVWTLAVANCGLLLLALLMCRSRLVSTRSVGREALVALLVVSWLMPAGLWQGHPAEIAIPILWVLAAMRAHRGRWLACGGLLGLASAVAPWGVLALPVALLCPAWRAGVKAATAALLISIASYLPFVLTGHFRLLHHRWLVYHGSVFHTLVPGVEQFGWDLRLIQAVLAVGACTYVSIRRRGQLDALWLAPLAPALIRVITDPVLGFYYWIPVGAVVVAGVALGGPAARTYRSWVPMAVLIYLPYNATLRYMWLPACATCLVAAGVLVLNSQRDLIATAHRWA